MDEASNDKVLEQRPVEARTDLGHPDEVHEALRRKEKTAKLRRSGLLLGHAASGREPPTATNKSNADHSWITTDHSWMQPLHAART